MERKKNAAAVALSKLNTPANQSKAGKVGGKMTWQKKTKEEQMAGIRKMVAARLAKRKQVG
jgi:hypothetical protein